MAFVNAVDLEQAEAKLSDWLAAKMPEAENVKASGLNFPDTSGRSSETVMFEASWDGGGEQLVARVAPQGEQLFMEYDLEKEFRVMEALGEQTPVPVPATRWFEPDPEVIGSPFLVMERVDGRAPADAPPFTKEGWVLDLSPEEQATLYENSLSVFAEIAKLDPDALGLDFLRAAQSGSAPLEWLIGENERFFEWASEGRPNPVLEAGLAWVRENRPTEDDRVVLSWGDARPPNMLYGDDVSVRAVLDWELVTVGSPELDLGWWLFLERHHSAGMGLPLPPGFPGKERVVERYQELTGYEVKHLEFYEVFAGLRASAMLARIANLMIKGGLLPADSTMALNNPGTQLLAGMLDIAPPEGAYASALD